MKIRKIIKKGAVRLPVVKGLYLENTSLNEQVSRQKQYIKDLHDHRDRLKADLARRSDPKASMAYQFAQNPNFQITQDDIEESIKTTKKIAGKIKTANWFLPDVQHISFGGFYTIFRVIEKMSIEGVENRLIIYGFNEINQEQLDTDIQNNFPKLTNYKVITRKLGEDEVDTLPACDIAVSTLWNSAYLLLRFNKTKQKFYFIQDYEPLFYPAGTISALAESTYRFGFKAIANTHALLNILNRDFGIKGVSFDPGIDDSYFNAHQKKAGKGDRVRIFFYARPNKPRNGFELGVEVIKQLTEAYKDKIEVIAAGSDWNEADYGLAGKVTNLGLLGSVKEVADVYATCDIGLTFMFTKHPSYQPLEFMAAGVATVVNRNEHNLWVLEDGNNCVISEPSPRAMAQAVSELIEDPDLRGRIRQNGSKYVKGMLWQPKIDKLWDDINKEVRQ